MSPPTCSDSIGFTSGGIYRIEVAPVVTDTCDPFLTVRLPFMSRVGRGRPPCYLRRNMRELGWWRKENNLNRKPTIIPSPRGLGYS